MNFNVTVVGIKPHDDIYYSTVEQPYWEISADGRLDVMTRDMEPVAAHMPGTFSAIIVEPIESDEIDILTEAVVTPLDSFAAADSAW